MFDKSNAFSITTCNLTSNNIQMGGSKGNLPKTWVSCRGVKYFVKAGRIDSRENPNKFGLESVIEFIAYRYAKSLNIPCIRQELGLARMTVYGEERQCVICIAEDYTKNTEAFNLDELQSEGLIRGYFDYLNINKYLQCEDFLNQLMLFDLLILNEDRHSKNLEFFVDEPCVLKPVPIFDNGSSMLYDDIRGLLGDYRRATTYALCNSFYSSFQNAENLIRGKECVKILPEVDIKCIVESVKEDYNKLNIDFQQNVEATDEWFNRVSSFLEWRWNYVKNL